MSLYCLRRLPLFFLLLFLFACAQKASFPAMESGREDNGAAADFTGVWLLRHRISVETGEKPALAFDGLMRLDPALNKIRAAGLAPMMTLFVIDMDMHGTQMLRMHPSLRRIPGIERNIDACIRALWMGRPAAAAPSGFREEDGKDFAPLLRYTDPAGRYTVQVRLVDAVYKREE